MSTLRHKPQSRLGVDLQAFRTDWPDEWRMDEFTRLAEDMFNEKQALRAELEAVKALVKEMAEQLGIMNQGYGADINADRLIERANKVEKG